jgi:alpha-L-arabinofuranosidase
MANFTAMTSLLANDPKKGTYKSPLFYTFKLFSNNCLGKSVDTYVQCDTFHTDKYKGIPYLDVTTTFSKETNTVFINVVNRHKDEAINAELLCTSGILSGKAEATLIDETDLAKPFEFDQQDEYIPVKKDIDTRDNKLSCTFPAHSFTQIRVIVGQK